MRHQDNVMQEYGINDQQLSTSTVNESTKSTTDDIRQEGISSSLVFNHFGRNLT